MSSIYESVATAEAVPTKDEIRERLPLSYVLEKTGFRLDKYGRAICPRHDDHDPSFRVYLGSDGIQRWSCFPCAAGGDVLALISWLFDIDRAPRLTFAETMKYARDLYSRLPADYVPSFTPEPSPHSYDPVAWAPLVDDARRYAFRPEGLLLLCKNLGLAHDLATAKLWHDHLIRTWGLGVTRGGGVYIPHWSSDSLLTGCKVRWGSDKTSMPGSRYEHLYGSWLGRDHERVLLVEGERDAIVASAQGLPLDVRSLPAGASAPRRDWREAVGRSPIICFDGDAAGRQAAHDWKRDLPDAVVLELPDGSDVCSAPDVALSAIHKEVRG